MCTSGNGKPRSAAEALGMIDAGLDYLTGPGGEAVDTPALGGVLRALAGTGAKHSAAWMRFLARFDANGCHDSDGYATSAAWLAGQCRIAPKAAGASFHDLKLLANAAWEKWKSQHPDPDDPDDGFDDRFARGVGSISCADPSIGNLVGSGGSAGKNAQIASVSYRIPGSTTNYNPVRSGLPADGAVARRNGGLPTDGAIAR